MGRLRRCLSPTRMMGRRCCAIGVTFRQGWRQLIRTGLRGPQRLRRERCRPYGTRVNFPRHPALPSPAFTYRRYAPTFGWCLFHRCSENSVLTHALTPASLLTGSDTAKRAAEKLALAAESQLPGAKARPSLRDLTARLKSCPSQNLFEAEFFS